jgi:leader peptidase (prepilin peptidase)/N-methyltransferase
LNVVVYRLPLGMSLIRPGSHCPACKRPIRWHDNIPVLGWFFLGGRCRDCRARISFRYPLVEAIAAGMFLAVGWAEGFSAGMNLPARWIPVDSGWLLRPLYWGEVWAVVAYHLLLLCTLLSAGLIEYDGHRPPARLMAPALVVGLLAPLAWPQLRPVPLHAAWTAPWAGLADGAAGLVAGLGLGLALWYTVGPRSQRSLLWAPACVGLFLGWQAAVVLGLVGAVLHAIVGLAGRSRQQARRVFFGLILTAVALAWILAWEPLARQWPILIRTL